MHAPVGLGMISPTMKHFALPIALFALLQACDSSAESEAPLPDAPKQDDAQYNKELLGPTGQVVDFGKQDKSAKDFPGLKIKDLAPGEGEETVSYGGSGVFKLRVSLSNGKSVYKNKEEVRLVTGAAIAGFVHGLHGMKKGGQRQLTIPTDLAFGERGHPPWQVPPRATLLVLAECAEIGAALDPALEVRRVTEGKGEPMQYGEQADVLYTGVLAEGEKAGLQFDSNKTNGRQFTIASPPSLLPPQQRPIEGWRLGLVGMRPGEKRWLKIPAHLAYGEQANGDIPANSTLIFEVELARIHGRT